MKAVQIHTKRRFLAPTLMLVLSLICAHAVTYTQPIEWTMVYDGSALPGESGAVKYANGDSGSWRYVPSSTPSRLGLSIVDGDYLGFDMTGIGTQSAYMDLDSGQGDRLLLNKDIGYTVEYRVRVLNSFNALDDKNNLVGGAGLIIGDGRDGVNSEWNIGFGADYNNPGKNYVQHIGGSLIEISDDWIIYTIVAKGDIVTFYMDGRLIGESAPRTNQNRSKIFWGKTTADPVGVEMEVDYLKIYDQGAIAPIPEPHTYASFCGLLVLMTVGFFHVRRRHR